MNDFLLVTGPLVGVIVDDGGLWLDTFDLRTLSDLEESENEGMDNPDGLYCAFIDWCEERMILPCDSSLEYWITSWECEEI